MLSVQNLVKEFKSLRALDGLSFRVEPGKIFGLLGPNGAGKTTCIRIILDIIKPTDGTVSFNGAPTNGAFRTIAGYLPEERGLYRKSRVEDVILYFARLKGMGLQAAKESMNHWLKKLEVEGLARRKIEELSKGNQQKIQFIASVVHSPKILILDEPFSGFDPINQDLIKNVILGLTSEGTTVILSTHMMEIAEELAENIVLINGGKAVISGPLSEIKKDFGDNSYRIEYERNDAGFLKDLPGVISSSIEPEASEITMEKNCLDSDLLRLLVPRLEVKKFVKIEPSLNSIFLKAVNRNNL